jgi:two-component system capsular synthesis sensor histidine kinase RcsC
MYTETTRIGPKSGLQLAEYAEPRHDPTSKRSAFPFHCLVVDDERRNRHLVTRMIEALGHKADKADNFDHAISKFAANGHNLVLTDLDMPYLDGYALAVSIKKTFRDAKIVIMTGRCQAEVSHLMSTGTVDAWLFKPFSLDELYKVLDALKSPDESKSADRKEKRRGNIQ